MTKNSHAAQLDGVIDRVLLPMESAQVDIINVPNVSERVLELLDPGKDSPPLVRWATMMHVKQTVRTRLAKRHDPVEIARDMISGGDVTDDLFGDTLQPYYPIRRNGERGYARREVLTQAEIEINARRMEKAGNALLTHARALRAWFTTKAA